MAKGRTTVAGLTRLRKRVLDRYPDAAREEIKKANDRNADEFMGLVRRILVKGDPRNGHLVDTLEKQDGEDTGVIVTIGGPAAPYPLHLEGGHRAPDGSHVPAKPFWNPAKRVLRPKTRGRASRAMSKAAKIAAGSS